jgi:hypothetical protein
MTNLMERNPDDLNLFVVKKNGYKAHDTDGFSDKMEAKKLRDELGGITDGYHVSYGPDHYKYKK